MPRRAPVVGVVGSLGVIAVDEVAARAAVATTPDNYAIPAAYRPPPAAWVGVLDTRNGRVVGADSIPNAPNGQSSPVGVTVDTRRGRFYTLATQSVTGMPPSHTILDMLDARSGRLLHRLTLPRAVTGSSDAPLVVAMAVDGQTGHLFIASGNDNTVSMLDIARL